MISHNQLEEDTAMTDGPSIDPSRFLIEQLDQASPDLLTTFVNTLLSVRPRRCEVPAPSLHRSVVSVDSQPPVSCSQS